RPRTAEELVGQLALEQRKEIPVVLRAFVKHNSRLDGLGVLFYPFGLLLTSAFIGAAFGATAAFGTLLGGLTVLPLAILMNRARRLLKSGFGHGDIGVAFRAELEQRARSGPWSTGMGRRLWSASCSWVGWSASVSGQRGGWRSCSPSGRPAGRAGYGRCL